MGKMLECVTSALRTLESDGILEIKATASSPARKREVLLSSVVPVFERLRVDLEGATPREWYPEVIKAYTSVHAKTVTVTHVRILLATATMIISICNVQIAAFFLDPTIPMDPMYYSAHRRAAMEYIVSLGDKEGNYELCELSLSISVSALQPSRLLCERLICT